MGMSLNSRSPLMRWGIVFCLTVAYLLLFPVLERAFGPAATSLAVLPVAVITWYFGLIAGLIASLLAILYSITFLIFVEKHNLETLLYFGLALRLLMLIIMVLLVHVVHNRLEGFMRIAAESRWRERYLTLLRITTNSILDPKNAEDRYYYLITHMVNLFVADYGYFFGWDEIQERAVLIASTLPPERPVDKIVLKPGESAISESILRTERGLAIDNVLNSQDTFHATLFKDLALPIHSILAFPLIAEQHKLGIVILAYESPRHFTTDEIDRAGNGGDQIALALQNVQRGADIQKRLRESNALANISLALSETEKIGLSNVLQLIVNSAKELIPNTQRAIIHLLDSERQELTPEAVIGYDNPVEGKRKKMRLGEGIAGQVIASGETINIANIETDTRFVKLGAPPKFRSLAVAPVQSGDQKLGTISILSNTPNAFSQEESRLLTALGIQAAIAIENANLLESIQQSLKESNALYRINQGLAASLNAGELLKDAVDLLQKSFGYYHVQVYVVEPETGNFIPRAGSGKIGDQLKVEKYHLSPGEGIVGYAAETGTPFFTNDVDEVVFFTRNHLLPDTRSELAVPVKVGDRILGVLDVHHIPPTDLTQRDIQLVSAVADQLAIALQNANLYEELQTSLEHEKAIRNQLVQNERLAIMGRLLATVSHELNNPLQAIQNALFLLKEEKGISPQGRQDLEIVLAESERMAGLIERLRSTYRAAQPQDFQDTQVNNIVKDVLALITTHLRHNQITFDFHPDPELPNIPALADQLRQVVLNLLMNAVEAMTSGGQLTVSTKLEHAEILLTVSDTGMGIDADILPNIFDAFVTNKLRGTGLGLTITHDIVIKHRGRITAENNADKGSTFSVWLPLENREAV